MSRRQNWIFQFQLKQLQLLKQSSVFFGAQMQPTVPSSSSPLAPGLSSSGLVKIGSERKQLRGWNKKSSSLSPSYNTKIKLGVITCNKLFSASHCACAYGSTHFSLDVINISCGSKVPCSETKCKFTIKD